jgi:hypothetical protein
MLALGIAAISYEELETLYGQIVTHRQTPR